jgi:hypothetical protein
MSLDRYSSARRGLTALVLFLIVAVLIAACGSSSSGTGTGTSAAAAGSGGNGSTADSAARYQARLNLAKCFRAHGLNVPDPTQGGGPAGGGGGTFRALQQYSQAQVNAAMQACKQYTAQAFPRLNQSPAQQAQFRQAFVKYAECMRSHGVNIPDPTTTTGGGFGLRQALGSVDRNSPAFQSAQKACQSLRPQFGGRGGPSA